MGEEWSEEDWPKNIKCAVAFEDSKYPILGHDTSADGTMLLVYPSCSQ